MSLAALTFVSGLLHFCNALPFRTEDFQLLPCDSSNPLQIFTINSGPKYSIISLNKQKYQNLAVNFDCDSCHRYTQMHTWYGSSTPATNNNTNQWWDIMTQNGLMFFQWHGNHSLCPRTFVSQSRAPLMFDLCDFSNKMFGWKYDSSTGLIHFGADLDLCMDGGTVLTVNKPCYQDTSLKTLPFCNPNLAVSSRVEDLIERLTITEKAYLLISGNVGVPRLGVPRISSGEALHGALTQCGKKYNGNTGCPTSYPHGLALGATFNRSLWRIIGDQISTEERGLFSQGLGALSVAAPDINLFRDPRWGRGQEVPGEDPFLTGQYAMHFSRGLQEGAPGSNHKYLKVVSTAKHYADYDQEGNHGVDRGLFNAIVSDRDQAEYYWPAWRAAVEGAQVKGVMCSYNAVNGIPACGNKLFMNDVMRSQWQFDGYIVSDCGAIVDPSFRRYVDDQLNGSYPLHIKFALEAGCDVNCGGFYPPAIIVSTSYGILSEKVVDKALERVLSLHIKLGELDENVPLRQIDYRQVDTEAHRGTAMRAAQQAMVLLKNEHKTLPLSKSAKVALIGPHFNATIDMLSDYEGQNVIVNSESPVDAFRRYGANIVGVAQGCSPSGNDTSGFALAKAVAIKADAIVMFVGLVPKPGCDACETEGFDRASVKFPGMQLELIELMLSLNKPVVIALINGGAIDISIPKAHAAAILECWYPGEFGGTAIASVMYGEVSPAGRLPTTVYDQSIDTARSIGEMDLRAFGGITYKYYQGTPVFPFGFGLSYTTFKYEWTNSTLMRKHIISTANLKQMYHQQYRQDTFENCVSYDVVVTNTGTVVSDTVVLGFVSGKPGSDQPKTELFDFERVSQLKPGEHVTVHLSISPGVMAMTDKKGKQYFASGEYRIWTGHSANADIEHRLFVEGLDEIV